MGAKKRKPRKKKETVEIINNFEYENEPEVNKNEIQDEFGAFNDNNPFDFKVNYDEEDKKEELKEKQKEVDEEEIEEEEIKVNEEISKKCSLDEHKDLDAIYYCQECKISMCKKCEKDHTRLLKNHHIISLDKDINEIFTGLCTKPNHALKLEYFCKTHNQLCCAACIAKVKNKWNGQHKNCDIYFIVKIKNSVKDKMNNNYKKLEELSNNLEPSIKELKDIYEKINESKEKLKGKIQNIFTKIRTELNNREDKLYEEVEAKYNELYFKEELIKESEKLPNMVKVSLDNGKIKENDWNDENLLPKLFNESIKFENAIKNIDDIYDKIKQFNSKKDTIIEFNLTEDEINKNFLNKIKRFGGIRVVDNKDIDFLPFMNING